MTSFVRPPPTSTFRSSTLTRKCHTVQNTSPTSCTFTTYGAGVMASVLANGMEPLLNSQLQAASSLSSTGSAAQHRSGRLASAVSKTRRHFAAVSVAGSFVLLRRKGSSARAARNNRSRSSPQSRCLPAPRLRRTWPRARPRTAADAACQPSCPRCLYQCGRVLCS